MQAVFECTNYTVMEDLNLGQNLTQAYKLKAIKSS